MVEAESVEKNEEKPPSTEDKAKPQLHSYWNFRSVVFQVENTLFSVLKHGFVEPGTPFQTMFSLPPEDPNNVEGSRDENPIVLEDTTANDFAAFLRILYPVGVPKVDSYDDWMGVLRLSHKWAFTQIRMNAITQLSPHVSGMTEHKKMSLGTTFLVREWFHEGLVDLATKQELDVDCLMQKPFCFDQGTVIKFLRIQNKAFECWLRKMPYASDDYECESCGARITYRNHNRLAPLIHYCPETYRANVTKLVDEYFTKELRSISFNT